LRVPLTKKGKKEKGKTHELGDKGPTLRKNVEGLYSPTKFGFLNGEIQNFFVEGGG